MVTGWKKWFRKPSERPWEPGPSILAVLSSWDGQQPLELPDEEPVIENQVRYASGARDSLTTHLLGPADEHSEAKVVHTALAALKRLLRSDDDKARAALYRVFLKNEVTPCAMALAQEVVRHQELDGEELQRHARWLVRVAAHREPLKFGIIVLGLVSTDDDLSTLMTLARHDEFTLHTAFAAGNRLEVTDAVQVWWEMAQNVSGWGKIHTVEHLCRHLADRPDIQAWLLRHGCANRVRPELLACCCATAGDLRDALSAEVIDEELLDGAGLIVSALFIGDDGKNIDSYPDGLFVLQRLLEHLAERTDTLDRLYVVNTVHKWLDWPRTPYRPEEFQPIPDFDWTAEDDQQLHQQLAEAWKHRAELGWTDEVCADLAGKCLAILKRPEWPEKVRAACESTDPGQRELACELAPAVGVDLEKPDALA
jgi:hypothetical protein